ncbi:MAG: YCII-related protein [Actinomycetia bacterium]|nr:YCII-related protein [Actinomycetes bacterium]
MKYMLLIYGNEELWASFDQEDLAVVIAQTEALHEELRQSGEFIGAYGVADQDMAKSVRLVDGVPVVTDGPYLEAKEYLGSFTIVDCESAERAYEIAALDPFARIGTVEVRALMHESGDEM